MVGEYRPGALWKTGVMSMLAITMLRLRRARHLLSGDGGQRNISLTDAGWRLLFVAAAAALVAALRAVETMTALRVMGRVLLLSPSEGWDLHILAA